MALTMNEIYEVIKSEGGKTPADKVMEIASEYPDKIAMRYKELGIWNETTYKDFWLKSKYVSMGLKFFGVDKGEAAAIHSENRPEWFFADIGIQAIGIVSVGLYPSNPPSEVEYLLSHSESKILFAEDQEQVDKALEVIDSLPMLEKIVYFEKRGLYSYDHPKLMSFGEFLDIGKSEYESHPEFVDEQVVKLEDDDVAMMIYTSGTTGTPKGIVRDIGGHIVALKWTMKNIYNIDEDDIWWSASDIGWIVGHSYIVYAPLFKGCTTVLFEGKPVGTPDAGAFWKIISDYKVKSLFTAPTAFRAIKKEDPEGKFFSKYDLSKFESLFLAGERADPDTIKWAENLLKVPVIDHWWQTETSWAISSNCTGIEMMKTKYGSACKAVPGYDVKIIKSDQTLAKPNEMGDIVVKLPLPPGTFPTLWNADQRYKENYMSNYDGYYQTYDAGHIDEDGYIWIMSRTDDIINVAGHRLSTGAIEEVLSEHQSVAECAVLGIADKLKGQLPIGLVVLKAGVDKSHEDISKECIQMVREKIGPVAAFKIAIVIKRLPKTRSGKILRGTIRKIADKEEYKMPPTIDDPAILDEIKADLKSNNIL